MGSQMDRDIPATTYATSSASFLVTLTSLALLLLPAIPAVNSGCFHSDRVEAAKDVIQAECHGEMVSITWDLSAEPLHLGSVDEMEIEYNCCCAESGQKSEGAFSSDFVSGSKTISPVTAAECVLSGCLYHDRLRTTVSLSPTTCTMKNNYESTPSIKPTLVLEVSMPGSRVLESTVKLAELSHVQANPTQTYRSMFTNDIKPTDVTDSPYNTPSNAVTGEIVGLVVAIVAFTSLALIVSLFLALAACRYSRRAASEVKDLKQVALQTPSLLDFQLPLTSTTTQISPAASIQSIIHSLQWDSKPCPVEEDRGTRLPAGKLSEQDYVHLSSGLRCNNNNIIRAGSSSRNSWNGGSFKTIIPEVELAEHYHNYEIFFPNEEAQRQSSDKETTDASKCLCVTPL